MTARGYCRLMVYNSDCFYLQFLPGCSGHKVFPETYFPATLEL
jgi:hypothetical protein